MLERGIKMEVQQERNKNPTLSDLDSALKCAGRLLLEKGIISMFRSLAHLSFLSAEPQSPI